MLKKLVLFYGFTSLFQPNLLAAALDDQDSNLDIQVISAKSSYTDMNISFTSCHFYDLKPINSNSGESTHSAKANCNSMFELRTKKPLFNSYNEPLAWVRVGDDGRINHATMRHWCGKIAVTVAVKESAYYSEDFEGIGFWTHASILNEKPEDQIMFYSKDHPLLKPVGVSRLSDDEPALIFEFAGNGPCSIAGSGSSNVEESVLFKPFVQYKDGIRRWEAVPENHGIKLNEQWDRSQSLLQ